MENKSKEKTNLFQIFLNLTFWEYFLCFLLFLLHSLDGVIGFGLTYWFLDSEIICSDKKKINTFNNEFSCDKFNTGLYRFSNKELSITSYYGLICSSNNKKVLLVTFIFFSEAFACFVFTFYKIKKNSRFKFLIFFVFLSSIMSTIIFYTNSLLIESICISILIFANTAFFLSIFVFCNENFSGNLKLILPSLLDTVWGFSTIFYTFFNFVFKKYKYVFLFYNGFIGYLGCFLSFFYFSKKNTNIENIRYLENKKNEINDKFLLKEILQDKKLRINFFIFTYLLIIDNNLYMEVFLTISKFFGNVYLNLLILGIFEIITALTVGKLILLFDTKNILINTYRTLTFFCFLFIFQQNQLQIFFTILVFLLKNLSNIIWTVCITYIQKIAPTKYHQIFFSFSTLLQMTFSILLPAYNELMKQLNISPFFGFFIFYLIGIILINYFKEYSSDEINEIELPFINN